MHSTDSSSLILGSSEDDEVIQEGLLRLRSVFSIASYMADLVSVKLRSWSCSTSVPLTRMNLILEGEITNFVHKLWNYCVMLFECSASVRKINNYIRKVYLQSDTCCKLYEPTRPCF